MASRTNTDLVASVTDLPQEHPPHGKLFVTGATGFLGRAFLNSAARSGWEIVALCRAPQVPGDSIHWLDRSLNDVTPADLKGCTACVHLAAAGVTSGENDWDLCYEINVRQSLAVWRSALRAGISQFVICGSCFEYGRSAERYEAIPVTAPLEPVTAYGASKAAATIGALALAASEGLSLSVLRPFHLYGEGEAPKRFWPALRTAALTGADFPMTSGVQVRDFTPVELAASRFLDELSSPPPVGRPVLRNLGTGRAQSLEAFARAWWQQWRATGRLLVGALPHRQNEVLRYVPLID